MNLLLFFRLFYWSFSELALLKRIKFMKTVILSIKKILLLHIKRLFP